MHIRFADPGDAAACLAVYAQYIDTSITFETVLPSEAEFSGRIRSYGAVYPWLFGDTADGEPPEAAKPEADRNPDDAPAGKEGEKKQKIRAIAIALTIVVIAFICVWFAARNMSNEADSTQIEDMEHEEIDIPDQDESGFDFEWKG